LEPAGAADGMDGRDILIGIDGGGSTCRFALLCGGERVEVTRGPANVHSDRDGAIRTLREGLAALSGMCGADLAEARLHAGLAGVLTGEDAGAVAGALAVRRSRVTDDRPTTMRGALGARDGTVAAIGTGSFFGRQAGGRQRFIGGWGYRLGDEASGAWLGRALLSAVLHAEDGLRPPSPLSQAVLARLGGTAGIVAFAKGASPGEMAALAAEVLGRADDPTAAGLLREGADWVLLAIRTLGWTPGERLCLLGGVGAHYAPLLGAETAPPEGTALDGALALAAEIPT
jgi:glucosamine kinase